MHLCTPPILRTLSYMTSMQKPTPTIKAQKQLQAGRSQPGGRQKSPHACTFVQTRGNAHACAPQKGSSRQRDGDNILPPWKSQNWQMPARDVDARLGGSPRRDGRLHIRPAHPVAADSGGLGLRAALLRLLLRTVRLRRLPGMHRRKGQRQPREG